jgi:DNA polymerase-1
MFINKVPQPKAVVVGNKNLINGRLMPHLIKNYIVPLDKDLINAISFYSLSGDYKNNKYLKKQFLADVEEILEFCENNDVKIIATTNAKFFQFATKDKNYLMNMEKGNILHGVGKLSGYTIVPLLNYFMLLPQPQRKPLLDFSINTLNRVLNGTYVKTKLIIDKVQTNVIDTIEDVRKLFQLLPHIPQLTMDIEATGLRVGKDRIITLAFADNEENGWCIPLCSEYWFEILTKNIEMYNIDTFIYENFKLLSNNYENLHGIDKVSSEVSGSEEFNAFMLNEYNSKAFKIYNYYPNHVDLYDQAEKLNYEARQLTKQFYNNYKGEQIWQNHGFDLPFIIRDIMGVTSIEYSKINDLINAWTFTDTMILKYLCVNGLERVGLGLKEFILPYYGEYDKDIDQNKLLEYSYYAVGKYNIYDATATFKMYNTYRPKVVTEGQEKILIEYYQPSMKTLLKIKCKGLVINKEKVVKADTKLREEVQKQQEILQNNEYIQDVQYDLNYDAMHKYNTTHIKQKTLSDFNIVFNPNSSAHKKLLLIDTFGYDVLETTKTGNASLGKDVIKQYTYEEKDEKKLEVLHAITEIANASKVSNTFFKAFLELAVDADDNTSRIHADFKLTGTISGRLSSANPNLQNLPSNSVFGKLLKSTCDAPEGFIWTSSDYASLEDFIIAEYTGDEVKKKILLEGYDSHSLYLASYIPDKLKELGLPYGNITKEESYIIKKDPQGKKLRDAHKPVTFSLAYQGTEHTVSKSLGIPLEEAKVIVDNYAKLHWRIKQNQKQIALEAKKVGYGITPAGLKIRSTQLRSEDEAVASQAMRSLTNAIYQGTAGMITVKAINKIQQRIEQNGYGDDIIIFNTIHDAIYAYVRHDLKILKWYNDNLIVCMTENYKENQVLKLKANLDIGYNWADQRELPNNCDEEVIRYTLSDEYLARKRK